MKTTDNLRSAAYLFDALHSVPPIWQEEWLSQALIQLAKLPENSESEMRRAAFVRRLLRGVEAEGIPAPSLMISSRQRSIVIEWTNGAKVVNVSIRAAGSFLATEWDGGFVARHFESTRNAVDTFRQIVGRLFPANLATAAEILDLSHTEQS